MTMLKLSLTLLCIIFFMTITSTNSTEIGGGVGFEVGEVAGYKLLR